MKPHIGASIFREIAAQHDRSGADEATILDGIDYREKMGVSDHDLRTGLTRLAAANLIELRGDRWFVAQAFAKELPRTPKRQISIASMHGGSLRSIALSPTSGRLARSCS